MSGLFATFNILRRAMGASQYALNTTSHNIANANTEGYSRQRVTLEASKALDSASLNSASGPGQLGTGVEVTEVSRTRDVFLDSQLRNEYSTLGKYEARDEFLSEIETIFMEPTEYGLSTAMGRMWDSWQELSRAPENSTMRTGVVENSKALTDMLNHTYTQLENLEIHSDGLVKGQIYEFNSIIKEIEDLNDQIMAVKIGNHNPNDLMDKQDVMIDKLSKLANIQVTRGALGQVTITSNGETVVGQGKQTLSYIKSVSRVDNGSGGYNTVITYYEKGDSTGGEKTMTIDDNAAGDFYNSIKDDKVIWTTNTAQAVATTGATHGTHGSDGTHGTVKKANIADGSIMGYASIYTEINEYKSQLNAMARGIAYSVNIVMNDGIAPGAVDADGNPLYTAFFVASDSTDESNITAKNIKVNPDIQKDNTKIKTQADPTDTTSKNADRALAIAQLRDARIYMNQFLDEKLVANIRSNNTIITNYHKFSTTDSLSMKIVEDPKGTTLDIFFRDTISKLGSSARQATGIVTSQQALIDQLNIRKESVSGVSMDEEMANMIQYQRSYEAAARVVSTIDELLDVVVNRMAR